jgi:hypothetical protein
MLFLKSHPPTGGVLGSMLARQSAAFRGKPAESMLEITNHPVLNLSAEDEKIR